MKRRLFKKLTAAQYDKIYQQFAEDQLEDFYNMTPGVKKAIDNMTDEQYKRLVYAIITGILNSDSIWNDVCQIVESELYSRNINPYV